MIDTGLKDKVVLITGANHGIGAATARAFASEGSRVFITYLRISPEDYGFSQEDIQKDTKPGLALIRGIQTTSGEEVAQAIRDRGGEAVALEADLAQPANIPNIFDKAERAFGCVQVLVNNAAHCQNPPDTIFNTTAESIDQHFSVNARGTVLMIAEYVKRFQKNNLHWGRIINISGDAATRPYNDTMSYGATKAAIESFTRTIAVDVGPLGITVNTVAPGPIQTGYITEESEKRLLPDIPLQRLGQPEDIADAIVFVASEQARWMTGEVIKVSGGHNM